MSVICHCIVPGKLSFYVCCGWYCTTCGGRVVERRFSPPTL
jgi:hypothetical protein